MVLGTLGFALIVSGQTLKVSVNSKGKCGYADSQGNVVVPCKYETAFPFEDGVGKVGKGGKYGFVNAEGRVVLPLKYEEIVPWRGSIYRVKSGKKYGLVSNTGATVLDVKYSYVSMPNCYGRAWIGKGGKIANVNKVACLTKAKYGIINERGVIVVEPKYKGLYEFSTPVALYSAPYGEGFLLAFTNHATSDTLKTDCAYLGYSNIAITTRKSGVLDSQGKIVMKCGKHDCILLPSSGVVRYYDVKSKSVTCGYYDLERGKDMKVKTIHSKLSEVTYWTHGDFTGDIAPVNSDEGWYFINRQGDKIHEGFNRIKHSQQVGWWAAYKGKTCTIFDETGKSIFGDYTDIAFPEKEGGMDLFAVEKDSKWGVVDKSGKEMLPFAYEQALAPRYGAVPVVEGGKWGCVSLSGAVLVPCEFESMLKPSCEGQREYWVKKTDGLWYNYNVAMKQLFEAGYKDVESFKNGFAWVRPEGFIVPENQLNRALLGLQSPVATSSKDKDAPVQLTFGQLESTFGIIIGKDGTTYFDAPIPLSLYPKVVDIINRHYMRPLTKSEAKKVLLYLSREHRSYPLNGQVEEENWDF